MDGVYANFQPIEGTTTGSDQTLTFARKSRRIIIMNDHATNELSYKFNASETYGTLKGTEILSVDHTTNQVIIKGTSIPYRIWVYG